jgi:hypothetical protein
MDHYGAADWIMRGSRLDTFDFRPEIIRWALH